MIKYCDKIYVFEWFRTELTKLRQICTIKTKTESSELEGQERCVIREDSTSDFEQIDKCFPLSWETINYVFTMVGDWCFEEEGQVRKNRTHLLSINLHSWEKISKHNHVVHKWYCKQWVFTYIVSANCVSSAQENLGWVLIHCSLRITNKGNVLNHNLVVNFIFPTWIKLFVTFYRIV